MSRYRKRYIKHHGEIPKGWVIHHIDGDRKNGDIDNLIALNPDFHVLVHKWYSKKVKLYEEAEDGTLILKGIQMPDRKKLIRLQREYEEYVKSGRPCRWENLEFRLLSI